MSKRFKIGDKISILLAQSTGHQKRIPIYAYGQIVERPATAPVPSQYGFHYVLRDGASQPAMEYVGKLHHLEPKPPTLDGTKDMSAEFAKARAEYLAAVRKPNVINLEGGNCNAKT